MDENSRNKILAEWGLIGLARQQQIIKIFEKVRDIPFGRTGSRDPKDVYERNKGTCSGKNFLARELYRGIGVGTEDMICLLRWNDLAWFPDDTYGVVEFPPELARLLEEQQIVDPHNYLKIWVGERWVTVDVSIDLPLKKLGFYTTEWWDGRSDMPLCFVGSHKVWACGQEGAAKKAELTAKLPPDMEANRQLFLRKLTEWLDDLRARGEV